MIKVMRKEGRKKPKFAFSIGAASPLEAFLISPLFRDMEITHHSDRVEARDGNVLYFAMGA